VEPGAAFSLYYGLTPILSASPSTSFPTLIASESSLLSVALIAASFSDTPMPLSVS
jgi:hypothetical protein